MASSSLVLSSSSSPNTLLFLPTSSCSSSSSRSYTRRWFNPLRRRNFDQPPLIERHWVEAPHQSLPSPERFTLASYNILGDRNASQHTDLYLNVPSRYINWDRRKRVISQELFGWDPHIICLQEVDKYFELSNIFVKAGYVGSYKSSACTQYTTIYRCLTIENLMNCANGAVETHWRFS